MFTKRFTCLVLCLLLCLSLGTSGLIGLGQTSLQPAYAESPAPYENPFDNASYLSQTGIPRNPPFTQADFETHGGRVVKLKKYTAPKYEQDFDIYHTLTIWPSLVGLGEDQAFDGWGFITDQSYEDSQGAWVSMTYPQVGSIKDINDPTKNVPVDLKVTYTINEAVGRNSPDPSLYGFDGHPAVHFTDIFSYGTFQFGVRSLGCKYEFFHAQTKEPLSIDRLYITATSLDKGEGISIEKALVDKIFLSDNAPCSGPSIAEYTRWETLPNSHIYDLGDARGSNKLSLVGAPSYANHKGELASPPNYIDQLGHPSYFWRSASLALNLHGTHSLEFDKLAIGERSWTGSSNPALEDRSGFSNNGTSFSTTNFIPREAISPHAPIKESKTKRLTLGDEFEFCIRQKIPILGLDSLSKFKTLKFTDTLQEELTPLEVWAEYPQGTRRDDIGSLKQNGNELHYELSNSFLQNTLSYDGQEILLKIRAKLTKLPSEMGAVKNTAYVSINHKIQASNELVIPTDSPKTEEPSPPTTTTCDPKANPQEAKKAINKGFYSTSNLPKASDDTTGIGIVAFLAFIFISLIARKIKRRPIYLPSKD